jgi:sulfide:quinone oxidoreductase
VSTGATDQAPIDVVIAGGGVAGIEAALALQQLAGDRVAVKLIAPNQDFVYRPMAVGEPFALQAARRHPLDEIARDVGAELLEDSLAGVDPERRTVRTGSGAEIRYDALVLGLGAQIRAAYDHAITIDDGRLDEQLHGLIQDIEGGYVGSVAFVVPPRMAWPFPIYELALMCARRAYEMNMKLAVTVVTPEDSPLQVFGDEASGAVAELLAADGIEVITSGHCEVPAAGQIHVTPGDRRLEVDRIVALPELDGRAVDGVPADPDGFIPVDEHSRVRGVERVYAAGDGTDFAIKLGGIAAQQADAAAESIAALAGATAEPQPFHPTIRGVLMTGGKPRYLSATITGGLSTASQISDEPTWSPTSKIVARYLTPYLEQRDRG